MRNMIKGGLWKNIEDEILKAAVMKYGLNQWSRISSLIVRKSAKQCKARWYEWLDPSIKKTEWSKEEEEKLLHLAKLFPNQWRTIAPAIGRTPSQCIEHYENLLEEAAGREIDEENDPRKLKPGEVDPAPETRPPRPDPVDMDEDEKEMLQEARARLSNTRGKKAKRKVREKQLEEGRRLATVQRKRELRASGIDMELKKRIKPKVREMDYNVEIPFEHMVPEGKFQKEATPVPSRDALMISAQHIEGSMRSEQEAKRKIEDERRLKRLKEINLPSAIAKIENMNDFKVPKKRTKLVLPTPQLTEIEIQNYAKLVSQPDSNEVTNLLVSGSDKIQTLLNPENIITPQGESTVHLEAYNAFLISNASTPLVGGFNQPLLSSVSPAFTPNKIARNLTPNPQGLNISSEAEVINALKEGARDVTESLEMLLPRPENSYEMFEDSEENEESSNQLSENENEDVAVDFKSLVVQKELPRPYVFNAKKYLEGKDGDLVADETVNLVLYDMFHHPMKGGKALPVCVDKELLDHTLIKTAEQLIQAEMQSGDIDFDCVHEKYDFDFAGKRPILHSEATLDTKISSSKVDFKYTSNIIQKLEKKNSILQEAVKTKTKDIQTKAHKLEKSIKQKLAKREKLRMENLVYTKLHSIESFNLQNRLNAYKKLVEEERAKERKLTEDLQATISSISAWEWCNKT